MRPAAALSQNSAWVKIVRFFFPGILRLGITFPTFLGLQPTKGGDPVSHSLHLRSDRWMLAYAKRSFA
jgi:hypothetical protein